MFNNTSSPKIRFSLILCTAIICLFLWGCYYFIFHSSFFKIRTIEVKGTDQKEVLMAQVKNILLQRKSLIFLPENIFFWSNSLLTKKKASLFRFYNISLKRDFKQKKILILAEERKPKGIICFNKDCFFFDKQGFVFAFAPFSQGFLYPVFQKDSQIALGRPILRESLLSNFFSYFHQLQNLSLPIISLKLKEKNKEMEVDAGKFTLLFSLEFPINNLKRKLSTLGANIDFSKINYLDFRVKDKVYYK